jgi:hypothetical protein
LITATIEGMSQSERDPAASPERQATERDATEAAEPESTRDTSALETFLPGAAPAAVPPAPAPITGLRTARLMLVQRREVDVLFAGEMAPRRVAIDADVDLEVLQEAFETGDRVLCEPDAAGDPVVVGVVRSRRPDTLKLAARRIEIEGDEEVLVKSGNGAMRLREDGDIEVVGSRISAASRGLFRLVGRMLRLN